MRKLTSTQPKSTGHDPSFAISTSSGIIGRAIIAARMKLDGHPQTVAGTARFEQRK